MNFEEVREYEPGDEIRSIDWNVTARMGQPYVKKFTEERELTVMIMLDLSASGDFGSTSQSKRELAAEVAAIMVLSAIRNNDKIGLLLFTDEVELFIPPKKGRSHALRVIREMLYFEPRGYGTDIGTALEYLNHIVPRRAVVFLLTDFESKEFESPLSVSAARHDLVAILIRDRFELNLPDLGMVILEDAETGEQVQVDTRSKAARIAFEALANRRDETIERLLRRNRIDVIPLLTGVDYLPALRAFFKRRERRMAAA